MPSSLAAEGRPLVRATGHRQDHDGARHRQGLRRHFHRYAAHSPPSPPLSLGCHFQHELANRSLVLETEVRASTLHDKYYGESQKLVHALFSLAAKLAPTIIFIDKIDLFLGHRGGDSELETSSHIKGAFMTLWDGMLSGAMTQVTIVGATNRPHEIDPAIQRRLTRQILVGLPDADARGAILRLLLQQQTVEHGFSVDVLATQTAGYSGGPSSYSSSPT